jgi:hypothetical protein
MADDTADAGSTSKTSTAKKPAASKSSGSRAPRKRASAPRAEAPRRMPAVEVAGAAARQLTQLSGHDPEGVSGIERTEDGWKVHVDVVELRRVPNTTDVLATYEVLVDDQGQLEGYRRLNRYSRGDTRDEQ